MSKDQILKEFEKKFGEPPMDRHGHFNWTKKELTYWFSTTLDEFEKELIADKQLIEIGTKLDGLEKDVLVAYKLKQQRLDIVEILEGMKKDESFGGSEFYKVGKIVEYNETLDQVIKKIKEVNK